VCKEVVEVEVGAEFLVKHLCHVLRSQKAIDSSMKKFDTVPKKISSGSRSVWHGLEEPFDRASSLPIMLSFLAVIGKLRIFTQSQYHQVWSTSSTIMALGNGEPV
jgi:hypothetical protein